MDGSLQLLSGNVIALSIRVMETYVISIGIFILINSNWKKGLNLQVEQRNSRKLLVYGIKVGKKESSEYWSGLNKVLHKYLQKLTTYLLMYGFQMSFANSIVSKRHSKCIFFSFNISFYPLMIEFLWNFFSYFRYSFCIRIWIKYYRLNSNENAFQCKAIGKGL